MTDKGIRVVKLGGSLLDWQLLPEQFRNWTTENQSARTLVVVGGGSIVNQYRDEAIRCAIDEEVAHWHCIELMSQTAAIASQLLGLPLVDTSDTNWRDITRQTPVTIVDLQYWIRTDPAVVSMPRTWDVSSDSIAAYCAIDFGASELVLLKSTLPKGSDIRVADQLSAGLLAPQLVDAHFPKAVSRFTGTVHLVNLRFSTP